MGRYYSGDVNGKFMFAVQSSDAHERFGAEEVDKDYIEYRVYRENYDYIVKELNKIDRESIDRVEKMFTENDGYNDAIMKEYNVTRDDLSEYADYNIGKQLIDFFDEYEDEDECNFIAEL